MTQRRALGDLDFDSAFDDPDNGWFGHVQADDPMSPRDHPDTAEPFVDEDALDTDRWPVITVDDDPELPTYEPPTYEAPTYVPLREDVPDHPRPVEPRVSRWAETSPAASPSWESRLSSSGAWDFKASKSGPRTPSKYVVAVLMAVGIAVAGVVLLMRSPGPADDDTTVAPPLSDSTAQPTTSSAPVLSTPSQAPPPPGPPGPPPPPPPPSAEEISPPVVTRDYTPRQQNAPDANKPEINVTRAPTTRTQMSATPPPPRVPDRNSSTPGDGPKRNGFGF